MGACRAPRRPSSPLEGSPRAFPSSIADVVEAQLATTNADVEKTLDGMNRLAAAVARLAAADRLPRHLARGRRQVATAGLLPRGRDAALVEHGAGRIA